MSRTITGVVVSEKASKTIVVAVETSKTHPIYKKKYTQTKRFAVHDEKNEAHVGDKVVARETRPISATKHFALERVVARAGVEHVDEADVVEEVVENDGGKK